MVSAIGLLDVLATIFVWGLGIGVAFLVVAGLLSGFVNVLHPITALDQYRPSRKVAAILLGVMFAIPLVLLIKAFA